MRASLFLKCALSLALVLLLSASSLASDIPVVDAGASIEDIQCSTCKVLAAGLAPLIRANVTKETLATFAIAYCELKKIQCGNPEACKELCTGVVRSHLDEFVQIVGNTVLSPPVVCYGIKLCPAPAPNPQPAGHVVVPSNLSNFEGEQLWPSWLQNGMGTFVHLSDIHLDFLYAPGSNTQCGQPLCCRARNGPGNGAHDTAGFWGDYACDTSPLLFDSLTHHLSSEQAPRPDFILYTGDDPAHDIWMQSKESNVENINKLSALLAKAFPDIPVFSTIGNHEAFPVNQFQGPHFDSWLYDAMSMAWAPYLPEDSINTMRYAGYYQARARPGLRVISLNTNFYTDDNFWLFENRTDFSSQFPWLKDVLRQAKERNEQAIIIGHAAPCNWVDEFAETFYDICEAYQDTIIGQFYGHSHTTSYLVIKDRKTKKTPIGVAYIAGSVTTYTNLNPGFQRYVYSRSRFPSIQQQAAQTPEQKKAQEQLLSRHGMMDDQKLLPTSKISPAVKSNQSELVVDLYGHWADLERANANNAVGDWGVVRYSGRDLYGLKSMEPTEWASFAERLLNDTTLYHNFLNNYYHGMKQTPPSPQIISCDILSGTSAEFKQCMNNNKAVRPLSRCEHHVPADLSAGGSGRVTELWLPDAHNQWRKVPVDDGSGM